MTDPEIVEISARKLIGLRIHTSLSENRTSELWRSFRPRVKNIQGLKQTGFYSVEKYEEGFTVDQLTPTTKFEKWAAVEVDRFDDMPEGLEPYTLAGGQYAVFIHRGTAGSFHQTAEYIFGHWMPHSKYELDDRAHFEIMGETYQPNDPNAEEEIWIPIRNKTPYVE